MKTIALSAAVVVIVYVSYSAGWQSGVESVPAYDEAREAEARAFWAALDEHPDDTSRLCERFVDDVRDLLSREGLERH